MEFDIKLDGTKMDINTQAGKEECSLHCKKGMFIESVLVLFCILIS